MIPLYLSFFCCCCGTVGQPVRQSQEPEDRFEVRVRGRPAAGHSGSAGDAVLRNPTRTVRQQVRDPEERGAAADGSDRHSATTD